MSLANVEIWPRRNVAVSREDYGGRQALKVTGAAGDDVVDKVAVLPLALQDGVVELMAAGMPEPGQPPDARSYFGIAFRGSPNFERFEALYVRPENARAADQLRRNRSTQYVAFPDRSWQKLREETPGRYESYVDLVPRRWIKLRVHLSGRVAKLYVNDAPEPALLVTDLKPAEAGHDRVALWIGNRTIAYFAEISFRAA